MKKLVSTVLLVTLIGLIQVTHAKENVIGDGKILSGFSTSAISDDEKKLNFKELLKDKSAYGLSLSLSKKIFKCLNYFGNTTIRFNGKVDFGSGFGCTLSKHDKVMIGIGAQQNDLIGNEGKTHSYITLKLRSNYRGETSLNLYVDKNGDFSGVRITKSHTFGR